MRAGEVEHRRRGAEVGVALTLVVEAEEPKDDLEVGAEPDLPAQVEGVVE